MQQEIAVGQIWREVDPRFTRFVCVEEVRGDTVTIQTVVKAEGRWDVKKRSRLGEANITRFNGKRGGCELVEAAQ